MNFYRKILCNKLFVSKYTKFTERNPINQIYNNFDSIQISTPKSYFHDYLFVMNNMNFILNGENEDYIRFTSIKLCHLSVKPIQSNFG